MSATSAPLAPLTVATVQAAPRPADVPGNARRAARLVTQAGAAGAALVVLPELFLSAYQLDVLAADFRTDVAADPARRVDDPRLDPLRAAVEETGAVVVVGAAVRHADGRRTCSVLVLRPGADCVAGYDKQHLWAGERDLFVPGDRGATLVVAGWRFGLGVCYDGCFPEHGRAAAADGAHGYLCPSGYLHGSAHRRDLYYAARALDNTMYVVFANSVDGTPPWSFNGGAAVYDPEGQVLVRGADRGEAVLTARLDPVRLSQVRDAQTMLADRLPHQGSSGRALLT